MLNIIVTTLSFLFLRCGFLVAVEEIAFKKQNRSDGVCNPHYLEQRTDQTNGSPHWPDTSLQLGKIRVYVFFFLMAFLSLALVRAQR